MRTRRADAERLVLWGLLAAWCLWLAFSAIVDGDVWFHLAGGRYTLTHLHPPLTDPFSYPSFGRPYICLQWLFQLLVYSFYRAFGEAGLVSCKALLVLAGFAMVHWACGLSSADGSLLLMATVTIACSETCTLRPQLLSLIYLAAFLGLWRKGRWPWLFPLLQLLWVNTHGLFVLGLFIVGVWAAGSIRSRWRVLLCTAAACFVNPYGLRGVLFPLTLATRIMGRSVYSENIQEFQPALGHALFLRHAAGWACLALFLACLTAGVVAWRRGRRRSEVAQLAVLFAGFAFLYLRAFRNIPLFAVVATWVLVALAPRVRRWSARYLRTRIGVAGSFLLLPIGICAWEAIAGYPTLLRRRQGVPGLPGVAGHAFPEGAATFLRETALPLARAGSTRPAAADAGPGSTPARHSGALFNDFNWGGYLIHELYPDALVFIDPRLEVHTAEHFTRYVALTRDASRFEALDREYSFDLAVFSHVPFVGMPDLFQYLWSRKEWRLAYADATAAVFRRCPESGGKGASPDPVLTSPPSTEAFGNLRRRYVAGEPVPFRPWRRPPLARLYPLVGWGHLFLYMGETVRGAACLLEAARYAPEVGDLHLFVAFAAVRLEDAEFFRSALTMLYTVQPDHRELEGLTRLGLHLILASDTAAANSNVE